MSGARKCEGLLNVASSSWGSRSRQKGVTLPRPLELKLEASRRVARIALLDCHSSPSHLLPGSKRVLHLNVANLSPANPHRTQSSADLTTSVPSMSFNISIRFIKFLYYFLQLFQQYCRAIDNGHICNFCYFLVIVDLDNIKNI